MKILIDAMGGDNAPHEIVKGVCLAHSELPVDLVLIGDEDAIRQTAQAQELSLDGIEIVHAADAISMEDAPLSVRDKTESSMRIAFNLLKEGKGNAFVSAGNTGALHAGSTLFVHRIKGIRRSAIATILPLSKPLLLIDSGANTVVTEEFLYQFAVMGSVYMEKVFGIKNPAVGLLNNGTESKKGTPLQVEAYKLLKSSNLNFVGNIEGKDIPFGKCDILVCDGFTGNIVLKMTEGMGAFMMQNIKKVFMATPLTKTAAIIYKPQLKKMKRQFDSSEYGGAPFLGISRPVIKAHGSSDAFAIKNAIKQAVIYINTGIINDIAERFQNLEDENGSQDNQS